MLSLIETDWRAWAHPCQIPDDGDWGTWLFLGGRGAGKTRAGAEWLSGLAEPGRRLALVGPTLHDVREVMIEGPSGLKAIAPPDQRPAYEASRRRLVWPNGAVAQAFSAEEPDRLRGPQFHHAWADEFCAWKAPGETLASLRLGLRLGEAPRLAVTTTPRPIRDLRTLIDEAGTVVTRAGTAVNAANLSPAFLDGLKALYAGTRLEAQEIDGRVLEGDGALWSLEMLGRARGAAPDHLETVVVGVDPPATAGGDACGIVVVGRRGGTAYVLEDATVRGRSPIGWATAVAEIVARHQADWVIAEINQGGDMVMEVLRQARCGARTRGVRAHLAKQLRAEPVAALYEQGRVVHCGAFPELEEELMRMGDGGRDSPDRADALVWAVTDLLLGRRGKPRLRRL
ncbi:DNA-packaging protein [Brevundimonas sp. VNH65]|uniref:DNA-packaging protein n=1 Tax=Brevundimonas sp. VNH65 TaxID=3400917 RepID=UPI003C07FFB2